MYLKWDYALPPIEATRFGSSAFSSANKLKHMRLHSSATQPCNIMSSIDQNTSVLCISHSFNFCSIGKPKTISMRKAYNKICNSNINILHWIMLIWTLSIHNSPSMTYTVLASNAKLFFFGMTLLLGQCVWSRSPSLEFHCSSPSLNMSCTTHCFIMTFPDEYLISKSSQHILTPWERNYILLRNTPTLFNTLVAVYKWNCAFKIDISFWISLLFYLQHYCIQLLISWNLLTNQWWLNWVPFCNQMATYYVHDYFLKYQNWESMPGHSVLNNTLCC